MPQSKMTLIGMEAYLNPEHSVFEDLVLPEGINKDDVIGAITLRCQEFELLYSDPDFMTAAVTLWGKKYYWTFNKWVTVMNKQYDALYNKDYYEDVTDTHQGSSQSSGNSQTTNNLRSEIDATNEHSEKAYNSGSTFVPTVKDDTDSVTTDTGTVSGTASNQASDSYTKGHTYHGYGNIGITSAQELFQKEIDVARFNLIDQIADLFCQEFCIMIY